jgi:hypothetical protein
LDRISKATKLVDKDRRDLQGTKKVRESDADRLRIRLCTYEGLDEALQKVTNVEGQFEVIEAKEGKLEALKGYILKLTTLALRIRELKSVESIKVPVIDIISQLGAKVDQVSKYAEDYDHRKAGVAGLKWVEALEVPAIDQIASLSSKLEAVTRFATEHERRSSRVEELEWVATLEDKVPGIAVLEGLSAKFELLDSWITKLRAAKAKFEVMNKIAKAPVPDVDALQQLQGKLVVLDQFLARHQALKGLVSTLEGDLAQVESEETALENEVTALGVCPTCVRPLTLDHSHA